jgi:hypothetical protein
MDEDLHLLDVFRRQPLLGVEVADFAGDLRVVQGGIEMGDRADA